MHWGKKIVLGMVLFMSFIIAMAVYMFSIHADALVEDDYYEQGLKYDQDYDKKKNALDTAVRPSIVQQKDKLVIAFKQQSNYNINLMRPADKRMDRLYKGTVTDSNIVTLPLKKADNGLWMVDVSWDANGIKYRFEKEIFIHEP